MPELSPLEPHLGSYRLARSLVFGWVLYLLLAISALVGLLGRRFHWIPDGLHGLAPYLFGAFLLLFVLYRFALVRAGRYSVGRAFLQIAIGVAFLTLLLAGHAPSAVLKPLPALMGHSDPSVRALACEAARYRPNGREFAAALVERLSDRSPGVREEARRSLRVIAGRDIGGEGPDAVARWSAWLEESASPGLPASLPGALEESP